MNDATIQSIFEKSINIPEQTICIDGILTDVNGFQMLAERWNGSEIILMEIEPCEDEVNMLATWKGKEIRLDLCSHEKYNLSMFIRCMNSWKGDCLTIGFSGPNIFFLGPV